jgi:formamidopyrimidine-DNA glycosylase
VPERKGTARPVPTVAWIGRRLFRPQRYHRIHPRRGEKVRRIRCADSQTNYCARCQTAGKVLGDRGLSRLLGADWPCTLEELEALMRR